jgi:hypothetical protein
MSLSPNLLPSNPIHCGTTAEHCLSFTLAESPLLSRFSLTHPARAGQQLEWTCDRTSEPPQVLTASLVFIYLTYVKPTLFQLITFPSTPINYRQNANKVPLFFPSLLHRLSSFFVRG